MERKRKLHYVFDTDCGGVGARARFWVKKGSFEPSCEVGYGPGCFFINRQSKVKIGSYSHVFNSEDTFMERRGITTITGNTL